MKMELFQKKFNAGHFRRYVYALRFAIDLHQARVQGGAQALEIEKQKKKKKKGHQSKF